MSDNRMMRRDFSVPLPSGGIAVLSLPIQMTEADFEQVYGTLEMWKAALTFLPAASPEEPKK